MNITPTGAAAMYFRRLLLDGDLGGRGGVDQYHTILVLIGLELQLLEVFVYLVLPAHQAVDLMSQVSRLKRVVVHLLLLDLHHFELRGCFSFSCLSTSTWAFNSAMLSVDVCVCYFDPVNRSRISAYFSSQTA